MGVQSRTVVGWIEKDLIPYLRLPGGEYRIPLTGFLASMSGTYNLAEELEKLDAQLGDVSEDDVISALRSSAPRRGVSD